MNKLVLILVTVILAACVCVCGVWYARFPFGENRGLRTNDMRPTKNEANEHGRRRQAPCSQTRPNERLRLIHKVRDLTSHFVLPYAARCSAAKSLVRESLT